MSCIVAETAILVDNASRHKISACGCIRAVEGGRTAADQFKTAIIGAVIGIAKACGNINRTAVQLVTESNRRVLPLHNCAAGIGEICCWRDIHDRQGKAGLAAGAAGVDPRNGHGSALDWAIAGIVAPGPSTIAIIGHRTD